MRCAFFWWGKSCLACPFLNQAAGGKGENRRRLLRCAASATRGFSTRNPTACRTHPAEQLEPDIKIKQIPPVKSTPGYLHIGLPWPLSTTLFHSQCEGVKAPHRNPLSQPRGHWRVLFACGSVILRMKSREVSTYRRLPSPVGKI